jgi:hypothetical protein
MPILKKLFDSIGHLNIFTIMDLRQGFNQIMFVVKDYKKTALHGSNKLWEWLMMPFGLKECTCLLSTNHGPGFQRGKFPEVLHK